MKSSVPQKKHSSSKVITTAVIKCKSKKEIFLLYNLTKSSLKEAEHTLVNEKVNTMQRDGITGYGFAKGVNPQIASIQALFLLLNK